MGKLLFDLYLNYQKSKKNKKIVLQKKEVIYLVAFITVILLLFTWAIWNQFFQNSTYSLILPLLALLLIIIIYFSSKNVAVTESAERITKYRIRCENVYEWLVENSFSNKEELEYCCLTLQEHINGKEKKKSETNRTIQFWIGTLLIQGMFICMNTIFKDIPIIEIEDIIIVIKCYIMVGVIAIELNSTIYLFRMVFIEFFENYIENMESFVDILNIILRTKFKKTEEKRKSKK